VAEALKAVPDAQVSLVNGDHGELTVTVNGKVVAQKGDAGLPEPAQVVQAVKAAA